jgi:hypothetical protein
MSELRLVEANQPQLTLHGTSAANRNSKQVISCYPLLLPKARRKLISLLADVGVMGEGYNAGHSALGETHLQLHLVASTSLNSLFLITTLTTHHPTPHQRCNNSTLQQHH